MHISYLPEAEIGFQILTEDESKHCVRVLRMQQGDPLLVTNGSGLLFQARIHDAHPKRCVIELLSAEKGNDHWPYHLHIAIAPTKNNDRLEWFLEKATEIGIDEISLFSAYHSERRTVNPERLHKLLVSAMKQSIKSRLPILNQMIDFKRFVTQKHDGQKYIAWIDDTVKELLVNDCRNGNNCLIMIGPEGDFSREEVNLAIDNGFKPISLGNARLRTETAALVACHTVQLINQMKR